MRIEWRREPEMDAWMGEHAMDASPSKVAESFRERFGIEITVNQVRNYRTRHGMWEGTRDEQGAPIGTESVRGGITMVKVRQRPSYPMGSDNWAPKQRLVWERTRGLKLPRGVNVVFCDHDRSNFDPANLKAVPIRLMAAINGIGWRDRATLEAAISLAELKMGITKKLMAPRRCGVCGKVFTPTNRKGIYSSPQRTCPECLAKGHRAREYGDRRCAICGRTFHATSSRSKYCDECKRGDWRLR